MNKNRASQGRDDFLFAWLCDAAMIAVHSYEYMPIKSVNNFLILKIIGRIKTIRLLSNVSILFRAIATTVDHVVCNVLARIKIEMFFTNRCVCGQKQNFPHTHTHTSAGKSSQFKSSKTEFFFKVNKDRSIN